MIYIDRATLSGMDLARQRATFCLERATVQAQVKSRLAHQLLNESRLDRLEMDGSGGGVIFLTGPPETACAALCGMSWKKCGYTAWPYPWNMN